MRKSKIKYVNSFLDDPASRNLSMIVCVKEELKSKNDNIYYSQQLKLFIKLYLNEPF